MPPTIAEISSADDDVTIQFNVEPDHDLNIMNPQGPDPDPQPSWGLLASNTLESFLTLGVINSDDIPSVSAKPKLAANA